MFSISSSRSSCERFLVPCHKHTGDQPLTKCDHMNRFRLSQELQVASHLKRHVFQEVCSAIVSLVLIATASIDPEADLAVGRNEDPYALGKHTSIHPNTNNNNNYNYSSNNYYR